MIRPHATAVRIAFIAAALAACSPEGKQADKAPASGADTSQDAAAIRALEARWNQEFKSGAVEAIVGHYADDATLVAPGAAPVMGWDPIRAALTEAMSDPKFDTSFASDKVVVAVSGDLAYSIGKFAQTGTNPKTHAVEHVTGTYVTVYRKAASGAWKAVADINSPGPAAP